MSNSTSQGNLAIQNNHELYNEIKNEMISNIRGCFEDEAHPFPNVDEFISENLGNIAKAITDLFFEVPIEEIRNREMDLVREFLFEYVTLPEEEDDEYEDN
jgi:hypothetical protein